MPYTMEDFRREVRKEVLRELSLQERLQGMTIEERLEGMTPEEITECLEKLKLQANQPE